MQASQPLNYIIEKTTTVLEPAAMIICQCDYMWMFLNEYLCDFFIIDEHVITWKCDLVYMGIPCEYVKKWIICENVKIWVFIWQCIVCLFNEYFVHVKMWKCELYVNTVIMWIWENVIWWICENVNQKCKCELYVKMWIICENVISWISENVNM